MRSLTHEAIHAPYQVPTKKNFDDKSDEPEVQRSTSESTKSVRPLRFCSIQAPDYPERLLYKVTAIDYNSDILAFGLEGGAIRVFDPEFDLISSITGHNSPIIGLKIVIEPTLSYLVSASKTSCLVSSIEEDETLSEKSFYSNIAGFTVYKDYVIVSTMDKVLTILDFSSDELCVEAEFDIDIAGSIQIREDSYDARLAELIVLSDDLLTIFAIRGIEFEPGSWQFCQRQNYQDKLTTFATIDNAVVCGTTGSNIR